MNTIPILMILAAEPVEADLSQWMVLALSSSPELVMDSCEVVQAEASRTLAKASLLPTLSASGSLGTNWMEDPAGDLEQGDLAVSGGITLSVPVLASGGSDWLRLESASITERIALLQQREGNLSLQLSVASAYYRTSGARMKVLSAWEAVCRDSVLLARTEVLAEMGAATGCEVLSARIQETSSRIALMEAESQSRNYLEELCRTAGVPDTVWTVGPRLPSTLQAEELEALPRDFTGSPSLQAAELRLEAAGIDCAASGRERFPSLSVNGSYNWNGSGSDIGSLDGSRSWSVGISMSRPIFDGGRISAGMNSARASAISAEASLSLERRALEASLNTIRRELISSQEKLELAGLSVEYASQRLELQEIRYEAGSAALDDLIEARRELTESEYTLIEARIDCLLQEAEYRVLCGMDVRSGD